MNHITATVPWLEDLARLCFSYMSMAAGLTPDIIDMFPDVTVVGSKVALMYLKGLTHRPFEQQVVKGGDKIDLGGGHEMEFVMAPNLHWPDTMFSFDHKSGQ